MGEFVILSISVFGISLIYFYIKEKSKEKKKIPFEILGTNSSTK